MYRILSFIFVLASCAFLVGCGNSSMSVAPPGSVLMSLTIGDAPPSGVAVLFNTTGTPTLVTRTLREHQGE